MVVPVLAHAIAKIYDVGAYSIAVRLSSSDAVVSGGHDVTVLVNQDAADSTAHACRTGSNDAGKFQEELVSRWAH